MRVWRCTVLLTVLEFDLQESQGKVRNTSDKRKVRKNQLKPERVTNFSLYVNNVLFPEGHYLWVDSGC